MKCYVCKLESDDESKVIIMDTTDDRKAVECDRCGKFIVTGTLGAMLDSQEANFDLSAHIRRSNLFTRKPVDMHSDTYKQICKELSYRYSVGEKQMLLLESLAEMTEFPGNLLELDIAMDYVLANAENGSEFEYHLKALRERKLLKDMPGIGNSIITPDGWNALEKYKHDSAKSDQGFVAMSFSESMRSIYTDAIKPAITEAGYKPYRVDEDRHLEKIDAKILSEIRKSRFLVADVTEQNNGVYYEAGYAQGLGIPVIWSVRKDKIDDVHFDTRQYRHIVWQDLAALKNELSEVILGFIGKGHLSE